MNDPVTAVAVAIGGSALIGGAGAYMGMRAQEKGTRKAIGEQAREFNITQEEFAPYRTAGTQALSQLTAGTAPRGQFNRPITMADLSIDPGYAFRLQQGEKALNQSSAARGEFFSGAAGKGLTAYGQAMGSQEYGNAYARYVGQQTDLFNRLSGIAGTGQQSTSTLAGLQGQTAGNISNLMQGQGQNQAGFYTNLANLGTSSVGMGMNYYQNQQLLNMLQQGGGSGAGSSIYGPGV